MSALTGSISVDNVKIKNSTRNTLTFKSSDSSKPDLKLTYDAYNFNIFNEEGKRVDIPDEHKDKDFWINFDFGTLTCPKTGQEINIKGEILGVGSVGYWFDKLNNIYSRQLERELNERGHEFCIDMGFYKSKDHRLALEVEAAGNGVFCYALAAFTGGMEKPGVDIRYLVDPAHMVCDLLICVDETFENPNSLRKQWTADQWTRYAHLAEILCSIMRGRLLPEDVDHSKIADVPTFPALCRSTYWTRQAFLELADGIDEYLEPFASAYCNTFRSFAMETMGIGARCSRSQFESNHTFHMVRFYSVCADISLETLILQNRVRISRDTRDHLLCRMANDLVAKHTALFNDAITYWREHSAGDDKNVTMIYAKNDNMTLQQAFDRVVKETTEVVRDFQRCKDLAKNVYPEDKDLEAYMHHCEGVMRGHIVWYQSIRRFGPHINFDLVVKDC